MGYYEQSQLSLDPDFRLRVSASAAVEVPNADGPTWMLANIWAIAAAPGFADAYASALAGSVPNPGRDPSVISDDQIRAAVQAETTPTPPTGGET